DRLGEVLGARRGALALAPRDAARDLAPSAGGLRRARHDVDQVGEVWNQPFLAAIRKIVVETLAQARVHAVEQPAAGVEVAREIAVLVARAVDLRQPGVELRTDARGDRGAHSSNSSNSRCSAPGRAAVSRNTTSRGSASTRWPDGMGVVSPRSYDS